jgi:hypothetical protein
MQTQQIPDDNQKRTHFPLLMELKSTPATIDRVIIVMFLSAGTGVVVHEENSDTKVGSDSTMWTMDLFTPYNGTVQLRNDY